MNPITINTTSFNPNAVNSSQTKTSGTTSLTSNVSSPTDLLTKPLNQANLTNTNSNNTPVVSKPIPVNPTPIASDITKVNPIVLPNNTSNVNNSLRATSDAAMSSTPTGTTVMSNGTVQNNPPQPQNNNSNPSNINNGNLIPDNSGNQNNKLLNQYQDLNTQLGTENNVRTGLNTQFGVDTKQQNYIDAFNQYNSKKVSYDQNIEKIRTDPHITKEQADSQINEISKEQNADLANLAVVTQAAQGNYTTALDIVQRKMDAQFQPVQAQIDNLKSIVQSPNSDLTASQTAKINANMFALQNNLTNTKNALSTGSQTLIQNGLYTADIGKQLDAAQTPEQVNSIISNAMAGAGYSYNPNGQGGNGQGSGPMTLPDGTQVSNPMSLSKINQLPQAYQQYVAGGPQGLVYIDENRLSSLSPGAQVPIRQQANNAGIPVLNSNDISGVQSLDVTFKSLDAMGQLASTALSSGLGGRIAGLTINSLAKQFQTGKNVTDPITGTQVPLGVLLGNFDQYRDAAIKAVQALAGGQGSGLRLNTGTIETAANNLPTSADNIESAKTKIATFQSLLTRQLSEKFPEIKPENQTSNTTGNSGSIFSNSSFYGN